MRAYKFLERDGTTIWTGTPWPLPSGDGPGAWMHGAEVRPCREGVHGCSADALAYWLRETMYEIELDGDIVQSRHKVAARRGRLVREIDEYPAAVRELSAVCTWRAREHAVAALRAAGEADLAEQFEHAGEIGTLEALGAVVVERLDADTHAAKAAMLAVDAAKFTLIEHAQEVPFIAACAAGHASDDFDAGYADERRFQSEWLAHRLGLG
jgi:hypothetical protein